LPEEMYQHSCKHMAWKLHWATSGKTSHQAMNLADTIQECPVWIITVLFFQVLPQKYWIMITTLHQLLWIYYSIAGFGVTPWNITFGKPAWLVKLTDSLILESSIYHLGDALCISLLQNLFCFILTKCLHNLSEVVGAI
jgi:hypothetical protein